MAVKRTQKCCGPTKRSSPVQILTLWMPLNNPVHMQQTHIGKAILIAARTRPKFIGGERAHYDESLKDGYPKF